MSKKITFFVAILAFCTFLNLNLFGDINKILPKEKPVLSTLIKEKKISQNIITPKNKPEKGVSINTVKKIVPESKPLKEEIIKKTEKIKKVENQKRINFLYPKSKPLTVKKEIKKIEKKSKFYSKKDFSLAIKSIDAMEKKEWTKALSISKKAKDKTIYKLYNGSIF